MVVREFHYAIVNRASRVYGLELNETVWLPCKQRVFSFIFCQDILFDIAQLLEETRFCFRAISCQCKRSGKIEF